LGKAQFEKAKTQKIQIMKSLKMKSLSLMTMMRIGQQLNDEWYNSREIEDAPVIEDENIVRGKHDLRKGCRRDILHSG
jgi:hypothetical protein